MIQGFEVLSTLFLVLMVYLTFIAYKRKHLSILSSFFWYAVWVLGFIGIAFNKYFNVFLESLDIMRVFDLYTIVGFMFFLFIIFYLFKKVKDNEKRLEELTRILALKSLKKEKGK
jgi:hypothetical protein